MNPETTTTEATESRSGSDKGWAIVQEPRCSVLILDKSKVPGLREDLVFELVPGERKNPKAVTIPLFNPGQIDINTPQGVVSIKIECWIKGHSTKRRIVI